MLGTCVGGMCSNVCIEQFSFFMLIELHSFLNWCSCFTCLKRFIQVIMFHTGILKQKLFTISSHGMFAYIVKPSHWELIRFHIH